jgi:hypothetical protein
MFVPRGALLALFNLIVIALALQSKTNSPVATTVDLGYARYQGQNLENGIKQWLGIRFAAPPLGDLRFRAPADPISVPGVQYASQVRPENFS